MKPPIVLQVNVRLSEGGAAGVARTLTDELESQGVSSEFAYGYGPSGRASHLEAAYGAHRLTSRLEAGANFASHQLLGREIVPLTLASRRAFDRLVAAVNIVHLHVTHSYMTALNGLVASIVDHRKPVVWTLHDHWTMTGRCAQPGGCELWKQGCPTCPTPTAYPPALTSRTAGTHRRKRSLISELQEKVPTTVVSCAAWLSEEAATAGFRNVVTIQNSVDRAFWEACAEAPTVNDPSGDMIFACRDLRDRVKIDWHALEQVASTYPGRLTILGDNSPIVVAGARHVPAVAGREALAASFQGHRRLIFTSTADYYPLTVAEALCAGLRVYMPDCPGAHEFSMFEQLHIYLSTNHLMKMLSAHEDTPRPDASKALEYFDPARMASAYLDVYRSLWRG